MKIFQFYCAYFFCLIFCLFFAENSLGQDLQTLETILAKQNFEEAKELIDEISIQDSMQTNAKMWYYKGLIYLNIADDFRGVLANLDSLALFKSFQALKKSLEIGEGAIADSAKKALNRLQITSLNQAASYFNRASEQAKSQQKDSLILETAYYYRTALESALISTQIKPTDTLSYSIAGSSALFLQDYIKYIQITEDRIELTQDKKKKLLQYEGLVAICRDRLKDTVKTLEVLDLALQEFPENIKFREARLALNVQNNDEYSLIHDAKEKINLDPKSAENYFQLAVIYQKFNRLEEALTQYEKCVKIDPSHFDATFYAGGIYYNKGVKILKELTNLNFTEYQKKGKWLDQEAAEQFRKALPFFEKLDALNPDNKAIGAYLEKINQILHIEVKKSEVISKKEHK